MRAEHYSEAADVEWINGSVISLTFIVQWSLSFLRGPVDYFGRQHFVPKESDEFFSPKSCLR